MNAARDYASPIARAVFFERRRRHAAKYGGVDWKEVERRILAELHPFELSVVRDRAKRIVLRCGSRAGKTTAMIARFFLKMARKKRADCLFLAKSRPAARDLIWGRLKNVVEDLGIRDAVSFSEARLEMRFSNGSTLKLEGADDRREVDKKRGRPRDEVWIDEAASHDPKLLDYLIDEAVGPRLGDYQGVLGLGGTPGRFLRGLFWETTKPGAELSQPWSEVEQDPDDEKWSFHFWNMPMVLEVCHVEAIANAWKTALRDKARKKWSDDNPIWRREYLGFWAQDFTQMVYAFQAERDGKLWNVWKPEKDELGIAKLPAAKGQWHHAMGMDLGSTDKTAIEIWAWDDCDPDHNLWHVFEYSERKQYARTIAEVLIGEDLAANNPSGVFGRIGWPDGAMADIGSVGGMVLLELANVYGISVEPFRDRDYNGAVEGLNGDLVDGRAHVMADTVLHEQLEGLQWDVDAYGKPVKSKKQKDDEADAATCGRAKAAHLLSEAPPPPPPRPESKYERVGREREPLAPRGVFDDMIGEFDYEDLDLGY